MPTDKELMQQALDALDLVTDLTTHDDVLYEAIDALRARLAQPKPEPVAWFIEGTFMDGTPSFIQVCETDPEFYTPLYTARLQREWQGLTDEEVNEAAHKCVKSGQSVNAAIRAIEAKLKEKNAL